MSSAVIHFIVCHVVLVDARRVQYHPLAGHSYQAQALSRVITKWYEGIPKAFLSEDPLQKQWQSCSTRKARYYQLNLVTSRQEWASYLLCPVPGSSSNSSWSLEFLNALHNEVLKALKSPTSFGLLDPEYLLSTLPGGSQYLTSQEYVEKIAFYDAWNTFLHQVESLVPGVAGHGYENIEIDPWFQDLQFRFVEVESCADDCVAVCMRATTDATSFLACYRFQLDVFTGAAPKLTLLDNVAEVSQLSPELLRDTDVIEPAGAPVALRASRLGKKVQQEAEIKVEISKASEQQASICMGSWNLGSERQIVEGVGPGVGSGGATGNDLVSGMRDLLQRCAGADFIAVTLQEVDDLRLPFYVNLLLDQLNQNADSFHRRYEHLGLVYAQSRVGEDGDTLHAHEDNKATEGDEGVAVFAFGLADRIASYVDIKTYSVSFGGISAMKKAIRSAVGTTAHKGGAFLQVPVSLPSSSGPAKLNLCFAGVHLDAKKPEKRHRTVKMVLDSMKDVGCNIATLAGDFNPRVRSGSCCPYHQMRFLLERGADDEVIDLSLQNDEIKHDWSAEPWWSLQEHDIDFLPTFHKFVERSNGPMSAKQQDIHTESPELDWLLGPYKQPQDAIAECSKHTASGHDPMAEMVKVTGSSYGISNFDDYWKDNACRDSGVNQFCYGGVFSLETCTNHLCYNVHDRDHCPGFTDRVFFGELVKASDDIDLKFKGRFYNSLEHVSAGDHTPVVSMFTVEVGSSSQHSAIQPMVRQPIDDREWIRGMENWRQELVKWPNGSGRRCERKGFGIFKTTGCPERESCYEVANKDQKQLAAMGFKINWISSMPHPQLDSRNATSIKCKKNAGNTFGICATNRHDADCLLELNV